jgi:hypothetical protein
MRNHVHVNACAQARRQMQKVSRGVAQWLMEMKEAPRQAAVSCDDISLDSEVQL